MHFPTAIKKVYNKNQFHQTQISEANCHSLSANSVRGGQITVLDTRKSESHFKSAEFMLVCECRRQIRIIYAHIIQNRVSRIGQIL